MEGYVVELIGGPKDGHRVLISVEVYRLRLPWKVPGEGGKIFQYEPRRFREVTPNGYRDGSGR